MVWKCVIPQDTPPMTDAGITKKMEKFPEEELARLKNDLEEQLKAPVALGVEEVRIANDLSRLINFVEGLRVAWKDADLAFQFADEEANDRAQEHGDCSHTRRAINAANAIARIKAALPAAPEGGKDT